MKVPNVRYINRKPYFLYRISKTLDCLKPIKAKKPNIRYFWIKVYNKRDGNYAYAIYLDRYITWW